MRQEQTYSIDDIRGYPEVKEKLLEIADAFKRYDKYQENSLDVPRGIFLSGGPGTGKTLFAKVLAAESGANFYELTRGGGLALRRLYRKAVRNAPSLIFIDEVDNYIDESYSFSSSLLTILDGFEGKTGVMFVLATNQPDEIPESVLRSGRMDEHIVFSLPNKEERKDILSYYLEQIPFQVDADVAAIAGKTDGFSGADLNNLVLMTARKAFSQNRHVLTTQDFYLPIHDIYYQDIRRVGKNVNSHAIAVHEVGHQIVAKLLPGIDSDSSLDIYSDSLGSTFFNDYGSLFDLQKDDDEEEDWDEEDDSAEEQKQRYGKTSFYEQLIAAVLGGRAAEIVVFGKPSFGAADDVNHAKNMAASLLSGGMYGYPYLDYSESYYYKGGEANMERREEKVKEILMHAEEQAIQVIKANRSLFERAVAALEQKTILTAEEFGTIIPKENTTAAS